MSRVRRDTAFVESLTCVHCEKTIGLVWRDVRPDEPKIWVTYEEYEDKYDVGF